MHVGFGYNLDRVQIFGPRKDLQFRLHHKKILQLQLFYSTSVVQYFTYVPSSATFLPQLKSIFTDVGGKDRVKRHGQLARWVSDLFVHNRHREDILRIFLCVAGLFFEVLNVGVSYINMSHVCFWRRSSSNQGHKRG